MNSKGPLAGARGARTGFAIAFALPFLAGACANLLGVRDLEGADGGTADGPTDANGAMESASRDDGAVDAAVDVTGDATGDVERAPDAGDTGANSDSASDSTPASDADASSDGGPESSDGDAGDGGADTATCNDTTSDPENCGTCGHSCGGGTCVQSRCQPVLVFEAPGNVRVTEVAFDDAASFVGLGDLGVLDTPVVRIPRAVANVFSPTDRRVLPMARRANGSAGAVAVDATHLYWLERGTQDDSNGAVIRVDKTDGANLTVLAAGEEYPRVMAVSNDRVFWADASISGLSIRVCAKAGCSQLATALVASSAPDQIVWYGGALFWSDAAGISTCDPNACVPRVVIGGGYAAFAISNDVMYFGRFFAGGSLERCSITSCATSRSNFASRQERIASIAVRDSRVYWVARNAQNTSTTSSIQSCPESGCGTGPTKHAAIEFTYGLYVDDAFIWYWDLATLRRVTK